MPVVRHSEGDVREKAEKALEKANAYNRSLIEASLDPLVTISPDGTISDVNEATIRITGCTRKELIGTDFSDYFTNPSKAKAVYEKVFSDVSVTDYEAGDSAQRWARDPGPV